MSALMNSISVQDQKIRPLDIEICSLFKHTYFACDITVQSGEDDVAILEVLGLALPHDEIAELLGHGRGLLPLHCLPVRLASRARRSPDGMEHQEGMLCEQEDESLAHGARGAQDT